MPNYYEISPAHSTLTLSDGKGSASFGVRYVGNRRVEARAAVLPMDGAESGWLKVEPPNQRYMEPGQTHTFKVAVEVPPGTAAGRYGLRVDVVSVDNPDEEYDRGPQVSFQVEKTKEPEPQQGFPWRWVILAAVLLILVIVAVVWMNDNGGSGAAEQADERLEQEPEVPAVPVRPRPQEELQPFQPRGQDVEPQLEQPQREQ